MFQRIYTLQWVFQALHGDEVVFSSICSKDFDRKDVFLEKALFNFYIWKGLKHVVHRVPNPKPGHRDPGRISLMVGVLVS